MYANNRVNIINNFNLMGDRCYTLYLLSLRANFKFKPICTGGHDLNDYCSAL